MAAIDRVVIENILESMPVGLAVIDKDGEIALTSAALADILGVSRGELERSGWGPLLFHAEHNVEFNQVLIDVIAEETVNLTRNAPYVRPDGEVRHLAVTSSFLRSEGKMAGVVVIVHDLTENQRLHEREKRILEENNRIQRERVEGLNNLALSVAHQIRNPVASIGGFAGLAARKVEPESSLAKYMNAIRDEAGKLEQVVRAVAEYASLPVAEPSECSVEGLAADARLRMEKRAGELERRYRYSQDVDGCSLWADRSHAVRALGELLVNAVEWSADGVAVALTAECSHGRVELSVSDDGPGIEKRNLPYLFDPFYTTKPVGVGMGLALARRIAVEAGGNLTVESDIGKGTRAILTLPSGAPS